MPPLTTQGRKLGILCDLTLFTMFLTGRHFLLRLPHNIHICPQASTLLGARRQRPSSGSSQQLLWARSPSYHFPRCDERYFWNTNLMPFPLQSFNCFSSPAGWFASVLLFFWYSLISGHPFSAPQIVYFNSAELAISEMYHFHVLLGLCTYWFLCLERTFLQSPFVQLMPFYFSGLGLSGTSLGSLSRVPLNSTPSFPYHVV